MKQFKVYKDIRKQAKIMGLSIALFSIMMTSVLVSLLVIIFSFSLLVVLVVCLFNLGLYVALIKFIQGRMNLHFQSVFPKTISVKHVNSLEYEQT